MMDKFKKTKGTVICYIAFAFILIITFLSLLWHIVKENHISLNDDEVIQPYKDDIDENSLYEVVKSMNIKINGNDYVINLDYNTTTEELSSMLPLKLTMSELNGNEKYVYLDEKLSTNSYNPNKINAGDVMLFGDNCLVIFYKSFETTYKYTKIGHIDDLPDLGTGNIDVIIEK